jgi:DNA repair protein RadA/Sms
VRLEDPGADLAVALALASAAKGVPLGASDRPLAAFGEIGLTGELRHAAHPDRRVAEAAKFGLKPVIAPRAGLTRLRAALSEALEGSDQVESEGVAARPRAV